MSSNNDRPRNRGLDRAARNRVNDGRPRRRMSGRCNPRSCLKTPDGLDASYAPAMSFVEIAAELGITPSGAWMLYKSALNKLRRHPEELAHLVAAAEELQRGRERSEIVEVQQ